jgi:phage terminase small subunit
MGARGRRAAADLATPQIDIRQQRLSPPDHLGPDERRRFIELVGACDPQHFRASDLPLLVRYVEADVMAERAAVELAASGPVLDGKASPWIVVQEKAVRALVALSMRLRVCPQSRTDPKTVGRKSNGPGISADDFLRIKVYGED